MRVLRKPVHKVLIGLRIDSFILDTCYPIVTSSNSRTGRLPTWPPFCPSSGQSPRLYARRPQAYSKLFELQSRKVYLRRQAMITWTTQSHLRLHRSFLWMRSQVQVRNSQPMNRNQRPYYGPVKSLVSGYVSYRTENMKKHFTDISAPSSSFLGRKSGKSHLAYSSSGSSLFSSNVLKHVCIFFGWVYLLTKMWVIACKPCFGVLFSL